jgi:hypothetical protein
MCKTAGLFFLLWTPRTGALGVLEVGDALGFKEEWAAGRGDAGDARGVKGPFLDFGCWAERLGIDFFTIFRKYSKCENNSRKFL